jgi:DNA-binding beta-propeller fold protein YncE
VLSGQTASYAFDIDTDANRPNCGLNVSATDGTLIAIESNTETRPGDGGRTEIVHNTTLTSCGDISFDWMAPVVATATNFSIYASGISSNNQDSDLDDDRTGNAHFIVTVLPAVAAQSVLEFESSVMEGVGGVDGLGDAQGIALSGDGANLYVAGQSEDAIVVFDVDAATGALSHRQTIKDTAQGGSADSLRNPVAVAVSVDGANVYAASDSDARVAAFTRGAQGELVFINDASPIISGLSDMVLSPDGMVLYVSATDSQNDGVALMAFDEMGVPSQFQLRRAGSSGIGNNQFTDVNPARRALTNKGNSKKLTRS